MPTSSRIITPLKEFNGAGRRSSTVDEFVDVYQVAACHLSAVSLILFTRSLILFTRLDSDC